MVDKKKCRYYLNEGQTFLPFECEAGFEIVPATADLRDGVAAFKPFRDTSNDGGFVL